MSRSNPSQRLANTAQNIGDATWRAGQRRWLAAFSPDSRSLVTASADGTAQVWSAVSGQPVTGPLRHDAAVADACFSADGRRVLTASDDCTVRKCRAETAESAVKSSSRHW